MLTLIVFLGTMAIFLGIIAGDLTLALNDPLLLHWDSLFIICIFLVVALIFEEPPA